MELEITPEPSPDERAAIVAALALSSTPEDESPWWRAGLPGVEPDDDG